MQKIASAVVALSLLMGTAAQAQDWTGFYAGGGLGYSEGQNTGSRAGPVINTWEGDTATGVQVFAFGGHNWSLGSNRIIGIESSIGVGEITGEGPGAAGNATTSITYGTSATLAVRLAHDAGQYLPYFSMGITAQEISATYSAAAGTIDRDPTFYVGTTIALGVDYMVSERGFLRVEIGHTGFDDVNYPRTPFPGGAPVLRATTLTDPGLTTARIGYALRF